MSIKTKTLNVHADSPDLRDRIYSPTLRLLGKTYNAEPFADEAWASRIKDQGQTFGLHRVRPFEPGRGAGFQSIERGRKA